MLTAKSRELFEFAYSKSSTDFYSPAEDSYLFLDTIEANMDEIMRSHPSPPLCLEVGPGSGVISAFTSRALADRQQSSMMITVDVNPAALYATQKTFACVGMSQSLECILGDATTCMFRRGVFDLMMCNPPYVPSDRNEIDHPLTAAWSGGLPDGREVTDKVIERAADSLYGNGDLWLLLDERNVPSAVARFAQSLGFKTQQVAKRKVPGELLYIFRFSKYLMFVTHKRE